MFFLNLTFRGPCIVSIFQYISNRMQRYTVYLYLKAALHVSGGKYTHHQEHAQLYLQHLVLQSSSNSSTMATGRIYGLTSTRCCRYIIACSWWWVEIPPETCRAAFRYTVYLHPVGYILEYRMMLLNVFIFYLILSLSFSLLILQSIYGKSSLVNIELSISDTTSPVLRYKISCVTPGLGYRKVHKKA